MSRKPNNYLIDACLKGNSLRLYFGSSVEEIRGDDWDDCPYESNCGIVYSEFVDCMIDVLVPFHYHITDHAEELGCYTNTMLSRNAFKSGEIPLFWIIDRRTDYHRDDTVFYMGDTEKVVIDRLKILDVMWRMTKK